MAKIDEIRNTNPVKIDLGGKTRTIAFDMNAFIELEKKYGSIQKAFEVLQEGKMADVRLILWAGLIHEEVELDEFGEPLHYNITPYQVGGWVKTPQEMVDFSEKLAQALQSDMPAPENLTPVKTKAAAAKNKTAPKGQAVVTLTEEEKAAQEEERKNA